MRATNPFLQEGLAAAFGRRAFRRVYTLMVLFLAVMTVGIWPKNPIADFLRGGSPPQAFQAVSIALLLLISYLGGRIGLEEYAREDFTAAADLASLPSVPVRAVVSGKFLFAALHTVFLLCLGLPFLAVSVTVCGFRPSALGRACLLIVPPALVVRSAGIFLNLAFDLTPVPRNLALFAVMAALFAGTVVLAPSWSPILLLADPGGSSAGPLLYASFFHALLVLCLIGASFAAMSFRRRRSGG